MKRDIIFTTIFTLAYIVQFIVMFLYYNTLGLEILTYIGWIIWIFSVYFGFISFWVFKKKGGVKKGEIYHKTQILVDSGPYALIRHPQYLGGILFTISITLWTQLWVSLLLTIIIIILTYHWTYREEKNLIQQFGKSYIKYQKRVTRLNPIVGLVKYFIRKNEKQTN
ncbi:MAG: methyltransferase family protein [Candidatus Hodarchaeota archaeon]